MGIILGLIIYLLGNIKAVRLDTTYVGGEIIPRDSRVSGVEFYDTIKDLGTLKKIYGQAEKKLFDIYYWCAKFIFFLIHGLRKIHSGALPTYLFWSLFGMLVLFIIMMFRI